MIKLISHIKQRIALPLPGSAAQLKMAPLSRINQLQAPPDARQSAVMILLFEQTGEWYTLLMRRTEDGRTHSGQISFPGGKREESDSDILMTALRETEEEIGIRRDQIQVLGQLSPLYIPPSNFHVTPVLGYLPGSVETNISPQEVQEVLTVPLRKLFDDSIKEERLITTSTNNQLRSPIYLLPPQHIVWGATAMIISELEHLIKEYI